MDDHTQETVIYQPGDKVKLGFEGLHLQAVWDSDQIIVRFSSSFESKDLLFCYDKAGSITLPELFDGWQANATDRYRAVNSAPASACMACGQCESSCPQKLPIMELLRQVSEAFEPKK